ncbi:hypothetical protein LTR53_008426 [Teratosphaeriaceae sp. CCFEE 6253]|nr:hypothetical protein LTR53_008426 [Teratosphaeriaceae sp. CCFEE 6253]
MAPPHLVHSHAHEGDIPGTVDLRAAEGDDTAYGQALFPVPAEDPNDPLQWPGWKKHMILVICSLYSFLSNSALYNWKQENAGLIALGNLIGYGLAVPLTWTSDRLAAHLTKRNGGVREAEMRLGVLIPAAIIAPAGLIVYGLTAQHDLHWIGYFAGVAMCDWGSYFFFTFTLAYAVDSYTANTSEMLIAMCVGKQLISFAFGIYVLEWVVQRGYATIIAGVFVGVLVANNVFVGVFMVFGRRIRRFYAGTWLAGWHRGTVRQVMTH